MELAPRILTLTFGETDATTGIWKPKTDPGISQATLW